MLPVTPSRGVSLSTREILSLSRSGHCASSPLTLIEAARAVRNIPRGYTPPYGNSAPQSAESATPQASPSVAESPVCVVIPVIPITLQRDNRSSCGAWNQKPRLAINLASAKSHTSLVSPAQWSPPSLNVPSGPPSPMDELLVKTLAFLTISPHTWRAFGTSNQTTAMAMRTKVYTKLRSLGMTYARVAEVCGHELDHVRHACRLTPHKPAKKNLKPGGRITEKENASAPQGDLEPTTNPKGTT